MPNFKDSFELEVKSDAGDLDALTDLLRQSARATEDVGKAAKRTESGVDQLDTSLDSLDRSADQARDSLEDTGDSGKKAGKSLDDAGKDAEKSGGLFSKLTDTLGGLKTGLLALVGIGGLGLSAIFAGTVGQFEAMDSAMRKFQAQTGASETEMALFSDTASTLFKEGWGENFDAVVQAMSQARTITGLEGDSLENITRRALVMSETFGTDVTDSLQAAASMATVFGGDTGESFDILIGAMQAGANRSGDLLDTIQEFGPAFEQLGFEPLEVMSLLSTGMDQGAKSGAVLGDVFKELNTRLTDGSADTAIWELGLDGLNGQFKRGEISGKEMWDQIRLALATTKDPLQQAKLGVEIFGEKWNEVGPDIILGMDEMSDKMVGIGDSTSQAQAALQRGLGPAWTRFTRTIRVGLIEALTPYIEKGLLKLIPLLESMGQWLNTVGIPAVIAFSQWIDQSGALNLVGDAVSFLVKTLSTLSPESITLIAGALGMVAGPAIVSGIVGLVGTIGGLATSLGGAALAAAPLVLVLGVVAAYESNFGGLRDKISDIREDFKSGDIDGGFQNIAEALISIPKGIVTEVIDPLVSPDLAGGLAAWDGIAKNLGTIKDALPGFIGSKLDSLGQDLDDKLVTPFKEKVELVKGVLTGDGLSSLKSVIRYIPAGLMSWLLDLPGQIYSFLGSPFESEIAVVKGLLTGEGVDGLKAGVSAVVGSLPTWLGGLGQVVLDNLTTPFTDAIVGLISLITGEDEGTIRATLTALPGQMGEWLSPLGDILSAAFAEPVAGAMNGMISLIELAVNKVIDQINGLAGYDLVEKGLGILGIDKPSIDHIDIPEIAIPTEDSGGRYKAGQPYWIGKGAQPEVFIPGESGMAIPSGALAALGGGGGSMSYNFYGDIVLNDIDNPRQFLRDLDREAQRQNKTMLKKGRTNR